VKRVTWLSAFLLAPQLQLLLTIVRAYRLYLLTYLPVLNILFKNKTGFNIALLKKAPF